MGTKTASGPIRPWAAKSSRKSADYRVFNIRTDRKVSPLTGAEHDFHIIESVNWVNVIAVTPRRELVMVEQYRHGSDTVELEIPGGMMDPGETDPVATAVREFREETGYEGGPARVIGQVFPNPAIMNNICYTVLISDCVPRHATVFDPTEDLITRLEPVAGISALISAGKIRHSLVIAALYHFEIWRAGSDSERGRGG